MKLLVLIVLLFIVSCPKPPPVEPELERIQFSFKLPTEREYSVIDSVVVWHGWDNSIIDTLYAEYSHSDVDVTYTDYYFINTKLRNGKNEFLARAWITSFGGGRPLVEVDLVKVYK